MSASEVNQLSNAVARVKLDGKAAYGTKKLAGKLEQKRGDLDRPVPLVSNYQKIRVQKNVPIYKYSVKIEQFFKNKNGEEVSVEISKSRGKGPEHEIDKAQCAKIYLKAVKNAPDLQKSGPWYYDRQGSLYSCSLLKTDTLSVTLTGPEISKQPTFVRAVFTISKVTDGFQTSTNDIGRTVSLVPSEIDKTLHESLNLMVSGKALDDNNVLTIGGCVHYLYDTGKLAVQTSRADGGKSSAVGASKSIKTLQGKEEKPSLYMNTELKQSMFHPDYANLLAVLMDYKQLNPRTPVNHPWAQGHKKLIIGLSCFLNYGPHKDLGNERRIVKITGISPSAREMVFEKDGKNVSVEKYFKDQYKMTLQYPELFTVEAKGRGGRKMNIPVECLDICNSQLVRTEQFGKKEQADFIGKTAARPYERKTLTDKVVELVGLGNDGQGLITVSEPETVTGYVLPKPTITSGGGARVNWINTASAGTRVSSDFSIEKLFKPASLTAWAVVFDENTTLESAVTAVVKQMRQMGMTVSEPQTMLISGGKLRPIFESAAKKKLQLLWFITKNGDEYHPKMKSLEQEFDILTQDTRFKTCENIYKQTNTRKNLVQKINVKLGGINYNVESDELSKETLIIGFETSQRGGDGDAPIAIGYSANTSQDHITFTGGYIIVERKGDLYGSIIKSVVLRSLKEMLKNRGVKPKIIAVYFSGVTEGQYGLINELYDAQIKSACMEMGDDCKPEIAVIAATRIHNTRLFKQDQNQIGNLEAGTIVDEVIVNPLINEWYAASSTARKGTSKAAKYCLVSYSAKEQKKLSHFENLTNTLCFDHQIVCQPTSYPSPLFIAGRMASRGSMILSEKRAIYTNGEFDFERTNSALGVFNKKLGNTRFNA